MQKILNGILGLFFKMILITAFCRTIGLILKEESLVSLAVLSEEMRKILKIQGAFLVAWEG